MKPELTVIIPVYNGMPFLPETVESILAQSFQNFRLVIVNDGSTDNSETYLNNLIDARVTVIHQKNIGLCNSLNNAIEAAETEFIARLDQDDVAMPSRLQQQIDFLKTHRDHDCVLSGISRISSTGKNFGAYNLNSSEKISHYDPSVYGCIVHSTICFRKEAFLKLGGYRAEVYPVDDYDLLLRFSEQCRMAVINAPLVKYRIHGQAETFNRFYDMGFKTRYVIKMAHQRNNGQPEMSMSEFNQIYNDIGIYQRIRRYTKSSGKLMFRKAGLLIGEKYYFSGLLNLLFACVLVPKFSIRRLFSLRRTAS